MPWCSERIPLIFRLIYIIQDFSSDQFCGNGTLFFHNIFVLFLLFEVSQKKSQKIKGQKVVVKILYDWVTAFVDTIQKNFTKTANYT